MPTTLTIDKKLLKEAMRYSGEKTKTATINRASEEFVKQKKLERLLNLSGKIHIDFDGLTENGG